MITQRVCAGAAASEQWRDRRLTGSHSAQGPAQPGLSPSAEALQAGVQARELAHASQPLSRPRLAEMSTKADVGFVKEASRQILAGGSAGKAAPPRARRFSSLRVPKRFSYKSPNEVSPSSSKLRAAGAEPEPAEREQRRPGAATGALGSSRRGARVGHSRVPCLLGS